MHAVFEGRYCELNMCSDFLLEDRGEICKT